MTIQEKQTLTTKLNNNNMQNKINTHIVVADMQFWSSQDPTPPELRETDSGVLETSPENRSNNLALREKSTCVLIKN